MAVWKLAGRCPESGGEWKRRAWGTGGRGTRREGGSRCWPRSG
jgi:hypothetical protein